MTPQGIAAILVVCLLLSGLVITLIVRGRLYVGYGVVWLTVFAGAAVVTAVPPLTAFVTRVTGAEYPASALTFVALVFIVLVLIYYSVQLSILATRVTRVAQELGTLLMDLKESGSDDHD